MCNTDYTKINYQVVYKENSLINKLVIKILRIYSLSLAIYNTKNAKKSLIKK